MQITEKLQTYLQQCINLANILSDFVNQVPFYRTLEVSYNRKTDPVQSKEYKINEYIFYFGFSDCIYFLPLVRYLFFSIEWWMNLLVPKTYVPLASSALRPSSNTMSSHYVSPPLLRITKKKKWKRKKFYRFLSLFKSNIVCLKISDRLTF